MRVPDFNPNIYARAKYTAERTSVETYIFNTSFYRIGEIMDCDLNQRTADERTYKHSLELVVSLNG
jgi:hypothetical protein